MIKSLSKMFFTLVILFSVFANIEARAEAVNINTDANIQLASVDLDNLRSFFEPEKTENTNQSEPNDGNIKLSNLSCGIKPIAPVGCTIGACVCDSNGRNCQWTTVCR